MAPLVNQITFNRMNAKSRNPLEGCPRKLDFLVTSSLSANHADRLSFFPTGSLVIGLARISAPRPVVNLPQLPRSQTLFSAAALQNVQPAQGNRNEPLERK